MLDQAFNTVYTKFKLHFYQKVFSRFENREATLTTVESFCMEGIMALGSPTVAQFAQAMHISTPNASYKINSLIQKGYVQKVRSETDRREYHLCPTQKYLDYYNISYAYLQTVVDRVKARFSPEDVAKLDEMLTVVGNELMPEIPTPESRDCPGRPAGGPAISYKNKAPPDAQEPTSFVRVPAAFCVACRRGREPCTRCMNFHKRLPFLQPTVIILLMRPCCGGAAFLVESFCIRRVLE